MLGLYIELTKEDRDLIKIEAAKRGITMRVLVLESIMRFISLPSCNPYQAREEQKQQQ